MFRLAELARADEAAPRSSGTGPPRLPFVLSVGVTGHHADMLPEGSLPALRARIRASCS
jgi:hypothetical protein